MTHLNELADRVERAQGPSAEERQLVIDAYNLIFPHELTLSEEEKGDDGTRYRRTMHRVQFTQFINTDYNRASLDAAMMLVPEGWNWMAGNRDQPKARAYVNNGELAFVGAGTRRNPKQRWYEVVAATPALALLAASLRAIAEQGEG